MISILSLFECITCSSSLPTEEIKLFAIVNWIFHVSDFLSLFMFIYLYSFKCGLILLRYSSTDSILFLSLLLSYPKIIYSNWFTIISFFFILKRFLISLSIISLIALYSFSSLKKFPISLITFSSSRLCQWLHHYMLWKSNCNFKQH